MSPRLKCLLKELGAHRLVRYLHAQPGLAEVPSRRRAETSDALSLRPFYSLLNLGQFVRLLEHESRHCGSACPEALQSVLDESLAEFERQAADAEKNLDYQVIPIRKLASIQLATALWAMDYVQTSPEFQAQQPEGDSQLAQ